MNDRPRSAFSLLEVVLALGIFALAVIALVGLSGPLLRDLKSERREGELESVLAAARSWVEREAKRDFEALRRELAGGRDYVAFLLEPFDGTGLAGWQIGTPNELAAYLEPNESGTPVRGPSVFLLRFEPVPEPASAAGRGYLPLQAALSERPLPEPGTDPATWLATGEATAAVSTFHLVALP